MIVISQDVVLGATVQADLNSPVFGWHSIVTESNTTASTSEETHPSANLTNPNTWQVWRGTGTGLHSVATESDGLQVLDYLAIARHNMSSTGRTVTVHTATNVPPTNWTIQASFIPATDEPILVRFLPGTYTGVRVFMSVGTGAPEIGVLYIGRLLVSERRIYVGHSPITLNRRTDIVSGRSESGNFLGRIVLQERNETSVELRNLSPAWYRAEFDPFVRAAVDRPFFFAWRPLSYPYEVGYAWLTDDPSPSNQLPNGFMQVGLNMTGIVK